LQKVPGYFSVQINRSANVWKGLQTPSSINASA